MAQQQARHFAELSPKDGQTIMKNVEQACVPFQFALSIAWDMLCVASDHDLEAYDHVYRSTILSKLNEVSSLRSILLVVRKTYARVGGQTRTV